MFGLPGFSSHRRGRLAGRNPQKNMRRMLLFFKREAYLVIMLKGD
jgi:hypothetical protein